MSDVETASDEYRSWPTLINRDPYLYASWPTATGTAAAVLRVVTTDGVVVVASLVYVTEAGIRRADEPRIAEVPSRVRRWMKEDGYTLSREVSA